jgi:hypothetical protein
MVSSKALTETTRTMLRASAGWEAERMATPETTGLADQATDGVARPSGPPRRASRRRPLAVFVALLALLVLAFASAVILDRRFRPEVGTTPGAALQSQGTGQAGAPRFARTPQEREVEQAFWRFLQVYEEALLTFDKSHLGEVLDGPALRLVTREVDDLQAGGWPVKVIEDDRSLTFADVTSTTATIEDRYVSRTVFVDPQTRQPVPRQDPPLRVLQTYEMRKVDGVWKVVGGTRDVVGRAG